uniref:transposase n=1 Tax=Herbaspirillum rubrisubalbicans TaxID=80842 RepID=UPI0009ED5918
MARREELTDEQWAILEPLIPETPRRDDGRGRPELHSNRAVMNGILWVLPSMRLSPWDDPNELLGIAPTIVIRSIKDLLPKALN